MSFRRKTQTFINMNTMTFKPVSSKIMNLDEPTVLFRKFLRNSVLCDIETKTESVENIFIHRNIINKMLDGKVSELILQHMDDGST